MVEWLSVSQLSKVSGIPETTVRRYLNNLEEYFRSEKIGRGKKYHPDSVEKLQRIAVLYNQDRETPEIKRILADEYAFIIEDSGDDDVTTHPLDYDISGKLDNFQKRQEDFNKQLLQELHEQQLYINELIKNQKQEQNKYLVSPEEKRADRFDQIMAERKVSHVLEERALKLWNDKPEVERTIKVGWFRKGEDIDKRDQFIKKYIESNFE